MTDAKDDNQLMNEFAGCSVSSYNQLANKYKHRLLNFVMKGLLNDRDTGEDVVQKTLIRVYEYKYRYKPTFGFSTWIYTIARNYAINELRKKQNYSIDDNASSIQNEVISELNIEANLENKELTEVIKTHIANLKPKYREIIIMRYMEELSYEEISGITGQKINTLKSLSKRGLEKIKENLGADGYDK